MTTEQGLRAATDQATSEVFVTLLEIVWPGIPEPRYFALNDEDIISNGKTYLKSGFSYTPPPQGEAGSLIGTLRIDIVDRSLVQIVKDLTARPQVLITEVLASDPDNHQLDLPVFDFFSLTWTGTIMQGSIGTANDSGEPSTSFNYTPQHAPALYAG